MTTSISLVWIEGQGRPCCRLARRLRAGVHGDADIRLRKRGMVPSPHMATSLPFACSSRISVAASVPGWPGRNRQRQPMRRSRGRRWVLTVIVTVRIPMRRSSAKRWRMPPLMMSLRSSRSNSILRRRISMHPELRDQFGDRVNLAHDVSADALLRASTTRRRRRIQVAQEIESTTPLRTPVEFARFDSAHAALRGERMNLACKFPPDRGRGSRVFTSTTMERPSGVSSASEAIWAASAKSCSVTPRSGLNSVAWRLPSVIVPVLSRRSVSTSPAASTARPDVGAH